MSARTRHWGGVAERGVFAGLAFTLFVYRRLGRWAVAPILYLIVGYFYLTGASARRAAARYLERVRASGAENVPGRFGLFMNFGRAILDKIGAWSGEIKPDAIVYSNYDSFRELLDARKGAVLIASHLGNIDVCRAMARQKYAVRMNVLVHTRHAENFNRLMRDVNGEAAVNLIQVTDFSVDTALMLKERVDAGEYVIIVGDRVPLGASGRVTKAEFLGADAWFPQGAFILAGLLHCPTRLIFCFSEGDRFRVAFEDFPHLEGMTRKNRAEKLEAATGAYAAHLGSYCRRYPGQWFNFYDFWAEPQRKEA